ncbi:MAG: acyl-CoA thioesterase [Planctomycetes bacterium]|nr:acyl-CoA thioesterase [Planctomycetota bacterium]
MSTEKHEIRIRVRYVETDAMGCLHHSNYFHYFEMGRTELFRANGGDYRAMEASGLFLVVVKLCCQYLKPARYDDLLTLETSLTKISAAKLLHGYRLLREQELIATGESTLACVNREGTVQRIPRDLPGFGDVASA